MKLSLRKNLKLAFLIALPLILFALVRDKASWRIQPIVAPIYMSDIAISPDDHWLARSGGDGQVFLSDLPDGKSVQHWDIGNRVPALKFSPNGEIVAAAWIKDDKENNTQSLGVTLHGADGKLRELEPMTKNLASDSPEQLRFSPDGKTIWLASTLNLRAWNLASGKLQWQWRSGDLKRYLGASSNSVAISTDCRFYFRCEDNNYLVWDIAHNKPALHLKNAVFDGESLKFSPDASLAMYANNSTTFFRVIIDTRSGRKLWRTAENEDPMFAGDKVVFAQENKFKVCNARTGKFLYELSAKPQSYVLPAASKDWLYSVEESSGDYFRQRFR